jgi:bifunctional non-homologous end joining protein LigD
MLASPGTLPSGPDTALTWAFEIKWDGMRVLATAGPDRFRLASRTGRDVGGRFPEVAAARPAQTALPDGSVLDGEVVAFDDAGVPSFARLAPRIQGAPAATASVSYVVFDLLRLGDADLTSLPYDERRARLAEVVAPGTGLLVPESFADGAALLEATRERGLEGVVAKRRASPYRQGVRSDDWIKVPHRTTRSYVVGGWKHSEAMPGRMASLLVGTPTGDGMLSYDGAVGSGLTSALDTALRTVLAEIETPDAPFHESGDLPRDAITFVRPVLVVDVVHLGRGGQGLLRHPAIERMRPDLTVHDLLADAVEEGTS